MDILECFCCRLVNTKTSRSEKKAINRQPDVVNLVAIAAARNSSCVPHGESFALCSVL